MIDFGLVTEYLDGKGEHVNQLETGFQGTPLTGSINALDGRYHSRRDDLESLGYTFMFVVNHQGVPWCNEVAIPPIL